VHYSLNPPGGETFEMVRARAQQFLRKVLTNHRGQRVLVFSHQNFMQQLHAAIRGQTAMQALEYDILNCELNQFHIAADGRLLAHQTVQLVKSANVYPSF
jgi:broad specificity phosphatase PhoE